MWEDAKRAYLKFINNEITMRHIERNPSTLMVWYGMVKFYLTNKQKYMVK